MGINLYLLIISNSIAQSSDRINEDAIYPILQHIPS